jgi:hypothetical protein
MQKIIIHKKYIDSIELPETRQAKALFFRIVTAVAKKQPLNVGIVFRPAKIKSLSNYQKGGAQDELAELELYIEMGKILKFDTRDAQKLKGTIESVTDLAHTHFNIKKRLQLLNKEKATKIEKKYLFWDIENFSNIGPMFNDLIEPMDIWDEHIYLAANPDSLYLYQAAWESEFYDYGKRLKSSFNFTKCDHGKNVADEILLQEFKDLNLKNSDVFIITYDRELKELFLEACHESNNLYIIGK